MDVSVVLERRLLLSEAGSACKRPRALESVWNEHEAANVTSCYAGACRGGRVRSRTVNHGRAGSGHGGAAGGARQYAGSNRYIGTDRVTSADRNSDGGRERNT